LHQSDIQANDYLFLEKFVQKKVKIFSSLQDVYELYAKKQIDMCISMRLHSMILCQSYGIEFIAIQYANKTQIFTK
jgi:polysaccharide pyruvyl transferase WcaK-like protein